MSLVAVAAGHGNFASGGETLDSVEMYQTSTKSVYER